MRKVPVPAHRYTPLKENWLKIFTPIVENLQLQVRFNLKTRNVEIKVSQCGCDFWCLKNASYYLLNLTSFISQTCKETQDISALTKAADFVKAFVLGFQVEVSGSEIITVNQLSNYVYEIQILNIIS